MTDLRKYMVLDWSRFTCQICQYQIRLMTVDGERGISIFLLERGLIFWGRSQFILAGLKFPTPLSRQRGEHDETTQFRKIDHAQGLDPQLDIIHHTLNKM